MATETAASDHASTTDEQFVKLEKDEDIAQKIISLSNEDEDKYGKPEDAQGQATPSSKTEREPEGDEKKAELPVVEIEKSDDSPALEASAEDNLKHYKVEDALSPAAPLSKTEGDNDKKAESAVVAEKTDDSVSLEAHDAVADNLKEEKELIPDSQIHDATSTEPTVKETSQQLEEEPIEIEEEMQHKTAHVPEASAETIEKSSNPAEANPVTESEAEVVKEADILETGAQMEKYEPDTVPVATEVQEKAEAAEKESQEKSQEAEVPSTVAITEPSAEANEKPSGAIEEEKTEPSAEVLIETHNHEVEPTETEKAEPAVTEVEENKKEPNTFAIPEDSAEAKDPIEEKTREPELEAVVLKETNNSQAAPTETEKTEVDENQSEPEKQSFKQEEEEQQKTVIPETAAESDKQPEDIAEVHPPKDSDIEVVKETGNSESEEVPGKEKPELVSTEMEEKPREQLQVGEEVGETSKDLETKQDFELETAKSEGTSDDTIKYPISLKEEKTVKDAENGEAQAALATVVEPSPEVAENTVEENGKKESNFTEAIERVSEEAAGVIKNPEQASIDQEAKTGLKEEREYFVPTSVEERVIVAANDDKKEPGTPDVVQGSSREAEVEIKNVEEQNEAKEATTEARSVKGESVEDDRLAVDNKKEGNTDTKVDEISTAVSEPVRETLASKFEEKEEEPIKSGVDNLEKEQIEEPVKTEVQATKESDATKTSKDLPKETTVKPAQKQSNNLISKVKQSLVKAKKAITGKSPSSKNLSSEAKGDIKVT